MDVVNVAAYKFVALDNLLELQAAFRKECLALKLKGTILLSTEGINLTIAGTRTGIDGFKAYLQADSRFDNLPYKESLSREQPFRRMLVKLKKEIITMGVEHIRPDKNPAPHLPPHVLKQWLDENRDIVLLDTRNTYEIEIGTFKNGLDLELKHFRHFPAAVAALDPALKSKPIVTYCTGGIRCEKAAPLLLEQGFKEVYQLEGGILKYFEECGGAHYQGECFVFDQRVAVDPNLQQTGAINCLACYKPVTVAEQQMASYVPNVSCPKCYSQHQSLR